MLEKYLNKAAMKLKDAKGDPWLSIDVVIFLVIFRSGMETEVTSVPAR